MAGSKEKLYKVLIRIYIVLIVIGVLVWFFTLKPEKIVVMEDYQGPNFPMSFVSETEGITVHREMELDFFDYKYSTVVGDNDERRVKVNDRYTISNLTDVQQTLELAYGFAGSYTTKGDMVPNVRIDGEIADRRYIGLAVGRTFLRYGIEADKQYGLENREKFELLLENGQYLEDTMYAVENIPVFSEKVYVYKFEEVVYDGNDKDIQSAYGKVLFEYNPEKTAIYTYGFNELKIEEEINSLGFRVPAIDADPNYMTDVYMIVVGDKLKIQDVKYYSHQESIKKIEDFSLELVEYETTFEDVLKEVAEENEEKPNQVSALKGRIYTIMTTEQILNTAKQLIADMRELEGQSKESVWALEDFLYNSFRNLRMFYRVVEVTVPANGSVQVDFFYDKYMGIKKIERVNYDGIEIMTSLGTNIDFASQKLKILGLDSSIVSAHTTGEELENGSIEIVLEDEVFEIYLEVPEKDMYKNHTSVWY